MKRRIPALFLALCIAISLLVPVSAAEGSARDAAQSYRSILNSTTLRARVAKPVLFYDLTGICFFSTVLSADGGRTCVIVGPGIRVVTDSICDHFILLEGDLLIQHCDVHQNPPSRTPNRSARRVSSIA